MLPLGADFEPVAQLEFKVVATGGALEHERKYGEQRSQGEEDELAAVSHEIIVRVSFFMKRFRTRGVIEYGSGMSGIIVPCSLLNVVLK